MCSLGSDQSISYQAGALVNKASSTMSSLGIQPVLYKPVMAIATCRFALLLPYRWMLPHLSSRIWAIHFASRSRRPRDVCNKRWLPKNGRENHSQSRTTERVREVQSNFAVCVLMKIILKGVIMVHRCCNDCVPEAVQVWQRCTFLPRIAVMFYFVLMSRSIIPCFLLLNWFSPWCSEI